ncbi:MAG: ATP-binding protein [Pseudomonadota bacterium]
MTQAQILTPPPQPRVGWLSEQEKDEHVTQLACLYAVADWIEASPNVDAFFRHLPRVLAPGLRHPEDVVVYATYQGRTWGEAPAVAACLSTQISVACEGCGEIRVAYRGGRHALHPSEQRMLAEVGRTLCLALERKALRERMAHQQQAQAEVGRHVSDLERQIADRTRELEEQRARLDSINAQLRHVNRSWEDAKTCLATIFSGLADDAALIHKDRTVVMTTHRPFEPGLPCHKTFFGRDTPCIDCRLSRILVDKTPITMTFQHGGRHLQVHALPIFTQDREVDGILEYYRDVTREKTDELQVQQADRLASLGQLVSGIGHEINNPNQFIRGNVRIVRQALEDMLPIVDAWHAEHPDLTIARLPYPFFRHHIMTLVADMAHGSDRIKSIVEGLRRFARRDEGLLTDAVDLDVIVEASARLVHNEVHKHADITLELNHDLPTFTGNSQKIEQVVVNLLVNAAQAMPDEGRGRITVRTRQEEGQVVLEVEDDGKGMNPATLKQIFEPFFTTKRGRGGTGLGLSIAHRIVDEHRGVILVRSTPGCGTCFTLRFPLTPAESPRSRP